jgi:hypothetical protein
MGCYCRFVQFVTGSPRLPAGAVISDETESFPCLELDLWCFTLFSGGAAALDPPFTVQKAPNPKLLPSSSTCFNLLKLPPYDSLDDLSAKIRIAVNEGLHSFALV